MTTFQLLLSSLLESATCVLPLGASLHSFLPTFFFDWPLLSEAHQAWVWVGVALGLFLFFFHEWASVLARFLQRLLFHWQFQKAPRSFDDALPWLLLLTAIPPLSFWALLQYWPRLGAFFPTLTPWNPVASSLVFLFLGSLLWGIDSFWNRKTKNWLDWRGFDALFVGFVQISTFFPGSDLLTTTLLGASLLHYQRHSGVQYAYFCLLPHLLVRLVQKPTGGAFWGLLREVSGWLCLGVGFFTTLIVVSSFLKSLEGNPFQKGLWYRLGLVLLMGLVSLFQ